MSRHARCLLLAVLLGAGCRQNMASEGRLKPLAESAVFADGRSAREPVAGTIVRGQLPPESVLATGMAGGREWPAFPQPVTADMLARGRERFQINCAPCHGLTGSGDGIIVQHGFPPPPSFALPRLQGMPPGHVVRVIAQGYGTMYPYAEHVSPPDRWAIAAYIRALQRGGLPEAHRP